MHDAAFIRHQYRKLTEPFQFGATTGRSRRCGPLDLPMLRYSTAINHYTVLNLTKLDVLDTLPDIKVAVAYKLDGKEVPFPDNATDLQKVEVVYETLPGWKQSIQGVRSFEELPENARKYVEYVEREIGVKIKWIGSVLLDGLLFHPLRNHTLTFAI